MEKKVLGGLFQINPVTKTGQRLYMVCWFCKIWLKISHFTFPLFSQVHMLLLPFLPITALIIQVGFLLIKFPHLNVVSHNQNLVPAQNVTELDNLERASAISD